MSELFQQIIQWVSLHPGWSSSVVFVVSLAESIALVGLIIPGVVIMFGLGALIASGAIPFWPAMGAAVAGAVLGDSLSFWIGHHYRAALTGLWPFRKYPKVMAQATTFFHKYGGKSVALGRFFGPVRGVIPLVAGMLGMSTRRFAIASVLSALLWAPAYLLPGMIFGASLELASEVTLRLAVIVLLLLVLAWLSLRLVHTLFRLLHPHTSAWTAAILRSGRRHPLLHEMSTALADPMHPEAKGLSILASLLLLATAGFILILGIAPGGGLMSGPDQILLQALQSLRSPLADHLMTAVTRLADTEVLLPLAMGCFGFFFWHGHRQTAIYWTAALIFSLLAATLLKLGLQIPRPDVVAHPPHSYSFPSGHTLRATVLYGFLAVIIARPLTSQYRWIPYSLAGLLVTGVALSRLYLGVHWLSDVLGSIALGTAWVAALGLAYHRHQTPESHWRGLALSAGLILITSYSLASGMQHQQQMASYAPAREVRSMSEDTWWEKSVTLLPAVRHGLNPRDKRPLNLQYAGTLAWIESYFAKQGWERAEPFTWSGMLKMLSPELSLVQLPLLPHVHDGQHEALALTKPLANDQRLVLRLWPAYIRLTPSGQTLWLGSITSQQKRQTLRLINYARTTAGTTRPLEQLSKALSALPSDQFSRHDDRLLFKNIK